jgi:hypothetical protein
LNFHLIRLPLDSSQSFPEKPYLQTAYYGQQGAKEKVRPIRPVPVCVYRHGRKFTDDYGILCIFIALSSGIPFGGWGLVRVSDGKRWSGWVIVALVLALDIGACGSGMIGRLPWDWWSCLHDGSEHSQNHQVFQHDAENVSQISALGMGGRATCDAQHC